MSLTTIRIAVPANILTVIVYMASPDTGTGIFYAVSVRQTLCIMVNVMDKSDMHAILRKNSMG